MEGSGTATLLANLLETLFWLRGLLSCARLRKAKAGINFPLKSTYNPGKNSVTCIKGEESVISYFFLHLTTVDTHLWNIT
jgi:hypothetical protein